MTDEEENWWLEAGYNDFYRGFEEVNTVGTISEEQSLQIEMWRLGWKQARLQQRMTRICLLVAGLGAAIGLILWYVR
jgi:hypothetical protein